METAPPRRRFKYTAFEYLTRNRSSSRVPCSRSLRRRSRGTVPYYTSTIQKRRVWSGFYYVAMSAGSLNPSLPVPRAQGGKEAVRGRGVEIVKSSMTGWIRRKTRFPPCGPSQVVSKIPKPNGGRVKIWTCGCTRTLRLYILRSSSCLSKFLLIISNSSILIKLYRRSGTRSIPGACCQHKPPLLGPGPADPEGLSRRINDPWMASFADVTCALGRVSYKYRPFNTHRPPGSFFVLPSPRLLRPFILPTSTPLNEGCQQNVYTHRCHDNVQTRSQDQSGALR